MVRTEATAIDHPAARWSGSGRPAGPARRIVSLLPSATEIVCALGLSDRLVAITHECDFPPEALGGVPRITANRLPAEVSGSRAIDAAVRASVTGGHGIYDLDEGAMAALQPDLVLTQELCRVCAVAYPTVLEAARSAGGHNGPLVVSLEPHTLADVFATIEVVAGLAGVEERGALLVSDLGRRVGAVERSRQRRRVAIAEWLDPLFAPGHWVPEQVEHAGGTPIIGWPGEPSRELAWTAVADADPDVLVLGLCGFDLAASVREWSTFEPPDVLTTTRAWRDGELWAIDGSAYVSRPGPRLVDGIEILAALLTGGADDRAVRLPRPIGLTATPILAIPVVETRRPSLPPRFVVRAAWLIHRAIYRFTRGRMGLWPAKPGKWGTLVLSTVGRKSGRPRKAILGYYEDGSNLVTLAMNGWGAPEPAWWLNLQAQPDASVELWNGERQVRGRAAVGEERERLWQRWREHGDDVDGYAVRRPGETAVVVLEPRG